LALAQPPALFDVCRYYGVGVQSANPTFGDHVALDGTLLNFPATDTTVTFGAESFINGAVLTNGNVMANGAIHLNFLPFSGALTRQ
jgi:hypothetical protein